MDTTYTNTEQPFTTAEITVLGAFAVIAATAFALPTAYGIALLVTQF